MPGYRRPAFLLIALLALIALLYVPSVVESFRDWGGWALSDLHINYADGFVRRGFLGEIAYRLRLLGVDTRHFFGALFVVVTAAEICLMSLLAWPLARRWPIVFVAVMLSPILLLFAAYDYGAYLRRDVFICLGILHHALTVRAVRGGALPVARYQLYVLAILSPYLLLSFAMHEIQTFFIPVHMALAIVALGTVRAARRPLAAFAAIGAICVLLAIVFRGDAETARRVCQSWSGLAGIKCWAIDTLGFGWAEIWAWNERVLSKPISVAMFAAAALLATLPILAVREATGRDGWDLPPARVMALALVPLLTTFILGWDWGRWIRFLALSALALLLSAPAKESAQDRPSPLTGVLALVATLAYVSTWKVRHCCEIDSIDGGFFVTLFSALARLFG